VHTLACPSRLLTLIAGLATASTAALAAQPQAALTVPLAQDDTAAGLPGGQKVYQLLTARQTNAGAFFAGRINGPGAADVTDSGVWLGTGGQQQLVLREGDSVPGSSPALVVGDLWTGAHYFLTQSGQRLGLTAQVRDVGNNNQGLAIYSVPTNGSPLSLVAQVGSTVPGTTGSTFSNLANSGSSLGINDSGRVAFQAAITAGGAVSANDEVIATTAGGTLELYAREGSTIPGYGTLKYGSGFAAGEFSAPFIDNANRVLATLPLDGPGVTNANNVGVFVFNSPSSVAMLIRKGDNAPGYPAGAKISNIVSRPYMTPGGSFSFVATVSTTNKKAVFVWGSGITKHMAEGEQAPGFPSGVLVTSIFNNSFVTDSGQIIVIGSTSTGTAIWAGPLGKPFLVAASGMTIPGVSFPGYITLTDPRPEINSSGEVIFKAAVQPGDAGATYDALVAWEAKRGLRIIAQAAQQVNISGVGNRAISTIALGTLPYFNNPDPYAGVLDNAGNVNFYANLTSAPHAAAIAANIRNAGVIPSYFGTPSTVNLLWQQTAALNAVAPGQIFNWFRNGSDAIESRYLGFVGDANWKLVGSGDFDRDNTLDLVWHNTSTGYVLIWLMNSNGTVRTTVNSGTSGAAQNWRCRMVADMNVDGTPDLVWQDEVTGTVGLWIMTSTGSMGSPAYTPTWIPIWSAADNNARPWRVVGATDMNADAVPDLLFRYEGNTQANLLGLMGVLTIKNNAVTGWFGINSVADLNWQVMGTNDIDGDGQQDILWRYIPNGALYYWRMNGAQNLATVYLGAVDPAYTLIRASNPMTR
jgi:hypothetical protein